MARRKKEECGEVLNVLEAALETPEHVSFTGKPKKPIKHDYFPARKVEPCIREQ